MSKSIGLAIGISALIAPAFKSSVSNATGRLSDLGKKVKEISQTKLDIERYKKLAKAGEISSKEFTTLADKLKLAKINVEKLDDEVKKLDKSSARLTDEQKQLKFSSNLDEIKKQFLGFALAGATVSKILSSVKTSMELTQSKGEIASLGISTAGIEAITDASIKFSNKFAGTTAPEFIRASYDIKSGIASLSDEGVAKFTSLAGVTAKATKASISDMTKLFAMGHGIFREQFSSDENFGSYFSNAIASSVQAFRTDGPDLIQGFSALGAVATKAGFSMQEQLAVLGVAKSSYNSASEAATGYKAILVGVSKAKDYINKNDITGLQLTNKDGSFMSMPDMLDNIKKKYGHLKGEALQGVLLKMFGSQEAVKAIMALIDKTDELREAEKKIDAEAKAGTIADDMAKAMNAGKSFDLLSQSITNLSAIFGKIFEPAVTSGVMAITSAVIKIQELITEYPTITKYLVIFTGALATVVLGYKAYRIAMAAARIAQIAFNISMAANPIGLVATAIAGLVTLGVYMYENWEEIAEGFKNIWGGIVDSFKYAWGQIKEHASMVWDFVKELFSNGIDILKAMVLKGIDFILAPFKLVMIAVRKVKKALGMDVEGETSFTAEINKTFDMTGLASATGKQFNHITSFGEKWDRASVQAHSNYMQPKKDAVQTTSKIIEGSAIQRILAHPPINKPATNTKNITYSPVINIQGNADKSTVEQAVKTGNNDFTNKLRTADPARLDYSY